MPMYDEKEILGCLEIVSNWQPSLEAADRAIERVRKTLTEGQTKQAVSDKKKRQTVKRIIEFAVAAVVITAVIIGISQFGSTPVEASVSWTNVIKNIEQAEMFTCRSKREELNTSKEKVYESDSIEYYSSRYGVRWDVYVNHEKIVNIYIYAPENTSTNVNHLKKTYSRVIHSEERIIQALDYYDPKKMVEMLLASGCKKLSPKKINGVLAEGIEGSLLSMHEYGVKSDMTRFWVNVETELPVLIEIERVSNDGKRQINTTIDEFQWDVELGSSVFEPNIPADYTSTK